MRTFSEFLLFLGGVLLFGGVSLTLITLAIILTNFSPLWRFLKMSQRYAARGAVVISIVIAVPSSMIFIFTWAGDFVAFIVESEKITGMRTVLFMFSPICFIAAAGVVGLVIAIVRGRLRANMETAVLIVLLALTLAASFFWVRTTLFGFDEVRLMFGFLQATMLFLLAWFGVLIVPVIGQRLLRNVELRRQAVLRAEEHPAAIWLREVQQGAADL